jgi:hypothetical protein
MVYLFMGLGLAQATVMALRYRAPAARSLVGLGAALMLLDFTPAHLATTQAACPAALDVIAQDSGHFGVLDLPRGYASGNAAMMLSACHGKPIVQGETARHMADTLADRLVTNDLAAQQRQLAGAHVKYIVLHSSAWPRTDGSRGQYTKIYPVVRRGAGLTILQVY